jgi:(1->4)-alpha-D-glucan 1-alpha-D-glucosylmutase
MENDEVFEATHGLVLDLISRGQLQGLRLDHLDGLYDPAGYCHQLRARLAEELTARRGGEPAAAAEEVYVVVEKILADHEHLPADWPVQGTTGYEFARVVGGLFVDGGQERALDRAYTRFVGQRVDYEELLYQSKLLIMRTSLASELNVLADQLDRISEADWRTRDFTRSKLREALREIVACFPVYRTYLAGGEPSAEDVRHVEWAVARARRRSRAIDQSIFDFLQEVLLGRVAAGTDPGLRSEVRHFARRFQQFSSPVTAKGMEDTTFYLYNRLLSLNEVGGEPEQVGVSPAAFHHANRERLRHWPHAMLGTSTHDSKRSEDVRARLNVLSEIPGRWAAAAARWSELNRRHRRKVGGAFAPVRNDEYAFYQNLLGIWPEHEPTAAERETLVGRLREAMLKSVREGKRHSSWINADQDYEQALARFIERALDATTGAHFLRELQPVLAGVAHHGRLGSLAQTLLKLTAPGVPDIYQGTEMWAQSLVDPDNRRPVDHAGHAARLAGLREQAGRRGPASVARAVLEDLPGGQAKLWLTWCALQLRGERPELFAAGDYVPVEATGPAADHVAAFARVHEGDAALVVVPRLTVGLCGWEGHPLPLGEDVWGETRLSLPDALAGVHLEDVLTGAELDVAPGCRTLPVASVLADFPAALLVIGDEEGD